MHPVYINYHLKVKYPSHFLSAMFNPLQMHSSTNKELFEKHHNQSKQL